MSRILLAIITLGLLASCSTKPSDMGGKNAVVAYISQHYPGAKVAVGGFQKTDGQQRQVRGADGYVMYFKASSEFADGYRPDCNPDERLIVGEDCASLGTIGAGAPVPIGTGLKLSGTIEFQKLEKGWLAVAVNVGEAKPFDMAAASDYYLKKPCAAIVDPNDVERLTKAKAVEPQKNKITVAADGMKWNETPLDETTLRQYLEFTQQMSPPPVLHVYVKKGASLPLVQRVWRAIRRSGVCQNVTPFTS